MIRITEKFVVVAVVAIVLLQGCKKNKPVSPNAQAPTITVAVSPTPQPTPAPGPRATPAPQTTATGTPGTSTTTKIHKHHKAPKPATTIEASNATAEPPTSPIGQLSSGMSQNDESRERQTTAQLLDGAEANLKRITRTLTAEEQATLTQIHNFETQAKTAIDQGDPVRAHTLALKANLLSEELLKQH